MKIYVKSNAFASNTISDGTKYGIFSANGEVRERDFRSAWDICDSDTKVKPLLEQFDTLEEANAVLDTDYYAEISRVKSNGGYYFYSGTVYFTAEIIEENGEIFPGDGYEITEFIEN